MTSANGSLNATANRRLLLLTSPQTYRAGAFIKAAEKLGIEVVQAIDLPAELAEFWGVTLGVPFADLEAATRAIVDYAARHPLGAILAVDDTGSLLAARASAALGLPHNRIGAAEAARDKHRMRQMLGEAAVPSPWFRLCSTSEDMSALAEQIPYPCVVKPLTLSGSRGVIRADDPTEFVTAVARLSRLLTRLEANATGHPFLVEGFIPGFEVALEGILDDGELHLLALFDKPDPLDGPFFEETIYVTPSRLPIAVQENIVATTAAAASALGLRQGPVHAELRVNESGAWIVELAGRSIGGLCSQTLRFGVDVSLEELILRQLFDRGSIRLERERQARGVMMIPIPESGLLRGVAGTAAAEAVPGIETVEITAKLNYHVVPLPEGDSYLGFIFARGETPEAVEAALREAHKRLHFEIEPVIPLTVRGNGR